MLIDTIGSVDDLIENIGLQREAMNSLIETKLSKFKSFCPIRNYNPEIIKPGLHAFEGQKIYLDTSCVEKTSPIDLTHLITENEKPTRANMQPEENSAWTARMAQSFKVLAISDYDKTLVQQCVLSTGFIGVKETVELPCSFLYAVFIGQSFRKAKDQLSTGSTMSAINNKEFLNLSVPSLKQNEMLDFDSQVKPLINHLSILREKEIALKQIKVKLLSIFFDF